MGKIGARKNSILKAVCTAPSFNKTPVGPSTPPLPYPTTQDLSNSESVAKSVKFNGDPSYVMSMSEQPSCKGDDPGVAKGVKSNTVNGYVKPTAHAPHFSAEKHKVIRQGDTNVMNGGNNPGIYITTQIPHPPGAAAQAAENGDAAPPIEAETPEEDDFLSAQGDSLAQAFGAHVNTAKVLAMEAIAAHSGIAPAQCASVVPGKKG